MAIIKGLLPTSSQAKHSTYKPSFDLVKQELSSPFHRVRNSGSKE